MKTIELSRKELYQQVWEEPITKLAKRYDLSDVGLAKTCKRHNIPIPGRGHWAKKASGKVVLQARLPRLSGSESYFSKITFQIRDQTELCESKEIDAQVAFEKDKENRIVVSETLESPHKLVKWTWNSLRSGNTDKKGICHQKVAECLDIKVTLSSLDRALRVMDALVRAIEARGYELRQCKSDARLSVVVNGEELDFSLEERIIRKDHLPTEVEKKKIAKRQIYPFQLPQHDYVPTGQLSLRIGGWYQSRATWADAKIQRVENCLNDFLVGLVRSAAEKKSVREKREREARKLQEEGRRLEEAARLRKEEQASVDALKKGSEDWHESQQIRSYIEAVRRDAIETTGAIVPGSELDEWLVWATKQADRLDPLTKSPPSILDEPEVNDHSWGIGVSLFQE